MKKLFKSIVTWLYIMFFIVQAFSMLSAFIIQNEFVTSASPFFRFWNALGTPIFENWLPFSILFVMIFVSGVLASQFKPETNISKHFFNFILLCINLFLCNRLYDTIVFQEKIEFIGKHFWDISSFVLTITIVLLIGYALKKAREARNSYTKKSSPHSTIIDDDDHIRNTDDSQRNAQEELFMKRYPISYIWSTFKYYLSRKKEFKYQKQAEYHEAKAKAKAEAKIEVIKKKYDKKVKSYNPKFSNGKDPNPALGIISVVTVIVIDVLIFVWILFPTTFGDSFFNILLSKIQNFVMAGSDFLDTMENPVLNWFLVFGNAFLITTVFILIDFLIYFIIRILLYFIFNSKEDSVHIKRFSRQLKTFFFGIVDGVMRLLLFLPDFLELIEDFLLDTDIDKLVREKFEEFDNQSSNKTLDDVSSDKDSPSSQEIPSNPDESEEK